MSGTPVEESNFRPMNPQFEDARLLPIRDKVLAGERLSFDDGVTLFRSTDLLGVGWLANVVRERINGNITYFNVNRHINPTDVCTASCRLCAFGKQVRNTAGYTMSLEQVWEVAGRGYSEAVSEFHIVGGLHPTLTLDWYCEMLRGLKQRYPQVHLKAFTMVEIDHMLKISGKSEEQVFADLREAGLGSCPGGGAEVLVDRVHKAVFREKQGPQGWLDTARKVQKAGFKMNATMLYGHIERVEERVTHLVKLRELQDECGGFMAYIPLAFWPYHTDLENFGHVTTGNLDQRSIAVGRLMLDNFPHVKAYWIMLTQESAQTALSFGANDMDGTVTEEKITHDAGTTEPQALNPQQLAHLIREAGYEPVQRTTVYEEIGAGA